MRELLDKNKIVFLKGLDKISTSIFLSFFLSVLFLGRFFSLIHLGNIYITELVLFFLLVLILVKIKNITEIPFKFLVPLILYFTLGCIHFFVGLKNNNLYTIRDSVFFSYILFFPIVYILFSKKNKLKKIATVLIISNILSLIIIRLCIYRDFTYESLLNIFFGKIRAFNYGLYYGIFIAFLVPLFQFVKSVKWKIGIIVLCAWNIYIIGIWGVRTAWLAFFVLAIFLVLIFKTRIFKFIGGLIIVLVAVSIILTTFFKLDANSFKAEIISGKLNSLRFFFDKKIKDIKITKGLPKSMLLQQEKKDKQIYSTTSGKKIFNMSLNFSEFDKDNKFSDKDIEKTKNIEKTKKFEVGLSNIMWRMSTWRTLLSYGLESPIVGRGFGVSPIIRVAVDEGEGFAITPAHNHIISIFYKMGFLGLALFLFINIYSFLYGFKYLRKIKDTFLQYFLIGCLGSFIVWNAMALFFNLINSPPTSIFLWIIIGLIFAVVKADKKNNLEQRNEKV